MSVVAERIGFIGLGAMGGPMARRLLDPGGRRLVVHDAVAERQAALVAAGAEAAATPAAVAAACGIVITMLPDTPDVELAVAGSEGVLAGLRRGGVLIEMSTIDPAASRSLHERVAAAGGRMLDAAVGRTSRHAAEGSLSLMVGGDADLLAACEPLLQPLATTITHCGPAGAGVTMKLVNNLLTGSIVAANAEALALARRAGLQQEVVLRVLRAGAARNTHLDATYPEKALAGDLEPGFATRLALKDLGLALRLAAAHRLPVGVGAAAAQLFALSAASGHADDDYTAALQTLDELQP